MASQPSSTNPKETKLVFVDDALPGVTRRRHGKGWAYTDPAGKRITDRAEIDRLNSIALPPAYVDAWFCPAPNGHILATGIDAKGRKQYRYHPDFRSRKEGEKFDNCLTFGSLLPLVRKRVAEDLNARKLTRARAIASVVRLLDLGRVRIGNRAYSRANKSFGATTLLNRHATITGQKLKLRYKGKSGKLREVTLTDRRLARVVRQMQDLPGQDMFQYVDEDGDTHSVTSSDVNGYLQEATGAAITAKNFRTFHASVMAYRLLAEGKGKLPIKALLKEVSSNLGNTPAIARKSYIHPAVIALVEEQEEWRAGLILPRKTRYLSREERGLLALLEASPAAEKLIAEAA